MKKAFVMTVFVFLAAALLIAGGRTEANKAGAKGFSGSYAFGGSTTVLPMLEDAIEQFGKQHSNVKLTYEATGSSAGITGVLDGVYKLGGSSREVKQEEKDKGVVPYPIALDGLTVIVNRSVTVDNLAMDQLARIFAGQVRNWKEVGGADRPIVVINRDEASGTRAAFLELVLQHKLGKEAKFILDAITVESNGDMVTKAGSTPDSIGYCGLGFVAQARSAGAKDLTIDKVAATVQNVVNKSYPISRTLFVVHKGQAAEGSLEKAFIDFLLSADGQKIVESKGFIMLPK